MSDLLERYIDGELSEAEAERFLAAVDEDPELAARLQTYERMLVAASVSAGPALSADFTDQVMLRVRAVAARARELVRGEDVTFPRRRRPVLRWVAMAACLVAAFGLGTLSPSLNPGSQNGETTVFDHVAWTPMDMVQGAVRPASAVPAEAGRRLVCLEYESTSDEVRNVAVAGSFNGWDPGRSPMQRENGCFQVFLMLPSGTHEYQFVENGERWVTDPLALQTRSDGFGGRNAVVDIAL